MLFVVIRIRESRTSIWVTGKSSVILDLLLFGWCPYEENEMADNILIFGDVNSRLRNRSVEFEQKVEDLGEHIQEVANKLQDIMAGMEPSEGRFRLEEYEVKLGVSATGKVGIIGVGGDVDGNGSLTLKFKRIKRDDC